MSRNRTITARFDGRFLVPARDDDLAFLREHYPSGTMLDVVVSQRRSMKHHNLYWGVLRRVVEINGGEPWFNAEALDAAVKTQLGMYGQGILLKDGHVRYELQSISFTAMDQAEFKHFFESAMQAIEESSKINMNRVVEDVKANMGWSASDEELFTHKPV